MSNDGSAMRLTTDRPSELDRTRKSIMGAPYGEIDDMNPRASAQ